MGFQPFGNPLSPDEMTEISKTLTGDKPPRDRSYRERGGCLTAFLLVFIGLSVLVLLQYITIALSESGQYRIAGLIASGIQAVVVACGVAVWNWKRWGLIGLVIFLVVGMGVNCLIGNLPAVGGGIIFVAVLLYLTNERQQDFT